MTGVEFDIDPAEARRLVHSAHPDGRTIGPQRLVVAAERLALSRWRGYKTPALTAGCRRNALDQATMILAGQCRGSCAEAQDAALSAALLDRLQARCRRASRRWQRGLEEVGGAARSDRRDAIAAVEASQRACASSRVRVPPGVIGIIYESRPNVTADAGALCLKSGNAVILRGGFGQPTAPSGAESSSPGRSGLPRLSLPATIQLVPPIGPRSARCSPGMQAPYRHVLVPRGRQEPAGARCRPRPGCQVIGHLEGNCHVYVDRDAELRYGADRDQRQDAPHRRVVRRRRRCWWTAHCPPWHF